MGCVKKLLLKSIYAKLNFKVVQKENARNPQTIIPCFQVKIAVHSSTSPLKYLPHFQNTMRICILFLLISSLISSSFSTITPLPSFGKLRAVNLGGWLVTEGWIKPSLFAGIPNKDLLDGTQLQIRSVINNKYLCAENGGGTILVANRTLPSLWETFQLWRITENSFQFRVLNNQFIGLDKTNIIVAVSNSPTRSETFRIFRSANDLTRVRIKAPNGFFLQAKTETLVTADGLENSTWGNDDPSVFLITSIFQMQGEFQVTNGYGIKKATQVMRKHWSSFIVEKDFQFVSQHGLNGVRIPVGWWIASGTNPPLPFVGGSLHYLDNAFKWAEKYNLHVIIDLHCAPGSQNGMEHSGARDNLLGWGRTDENIAQTVAVIEFLTKRYAKSPSLLAVELLNEPQAPILRLSTLQKYYKLGYEAVRRHSNAYVIMSNRLGANTRELLRFASGFRGSVIDIHFYSLFSGIFNNLTVQQNINFVNRRRSVELAAATVSNAPPIFVGEWTAEWQVKGASKEDYQRFAAAEMNVFGRASFGWSYWCLKNVNEHWSLEWMINNGYINITN